MIFFLLFLCVFGNPVGPMYPIEEVNQVIKGTLTNQGDYHQYNISLDLLFLGIGDNVNVNIVLLPWQSGTHLYTALTGPGGPQPEYTFCQTAGACMKSEQYYFNVVHFNKSNGYFNEHKGDQNLKITVQYNKFGSHTIDYSSVQYSLYVSKLSTTHNWNDMLPNTPIVNEITNSMEFDYYNFKLYNKDNIDAVVTPITTDVDPDVFMSSYTSTPNFHTDYHQRYLQISNTFDVIHALTTDEQYGGCVNPTLSNPCTWGLSVTSILDRNFYYSTYWFPKNDSAINPGFTMLYEGIEIGGEVAEKEYNYFRFYLPQESAPTQKRLVLSVFNTRDWGDPDIFLLYPNSSYTGDKKPGRHHCDICFGQRIGSDEIIIENPQYFGMYHLAVYGFEASKYLITWFKEGSIVINNKEPMELTVKAGESIFFRYVNMMTIFNILINADCEDNTNMEMYLTYKNSESLIQPFPNPKQFDHKGVKAGYGTGIYYYYPKPTKRGNYFFSLFNTGTTDQQVTVSVQTNQSHVYLRDGEMYFYQTVMKDQYRYYEFQYDYALHNWTSYTTFNFIVTPSSMFGDVDLFVGTSKSGIKYPTKEHHDYASTDWMDDTIVIFADKYQIKPEEFYIGVWGNPWQEVNTYSIVGYVADKEIMLQENVAFSDSCRTNQYRRFVVEIFEQSNVDFIVSKQDSRDGLKVYVNYKDKDDTPFPHEGKADYTSTGFDNQEQINLPYAKKGVYLITVKATYLYQKTQAKYEIVVAANYRKVVVDFQTLELIAPKGTIETIKFMVADQRRLMFSFPVFYGELEVYLCMNESKTCGTTPGSYDYYHSEWSVTGFSFVIDKDDPDYHFMNYNYWTALVVSKVDSNYLFSVESFHQNISNIVQYGTNMEPGTPKLVELRAGVAKIDEGYFLKFAFLVDNDWQVDQPADESWIIELRHVGGIVDVYITQDLNHNPSPKYCTFGKCPIEVGHKNQLIYLDQASLKKGYVFFTIFNKQGFWNSRLMVTVYPVSNGAVTDAVNQLLFQDEFYEDTFAGDYRYFESMAVKSRGMTDYYDEGMVITEACGETNAPMIYLNVQDKGQADVSHRPTPQAGQYQFSSVPTRSVDQLGAVRQQVSVTGHTNPEVYYYLVESFQNPNEAGVFVTNRMNGSRPVLHSPKITYDNGGEVSLYIPLADVPPRFPHHGLFWTVFTRQMVKTEIKSGINFDTPCAITSHQNTVVNVGPNFDPSTKPVISGTPCDTEKCMKFQLKRGTDFDVNGIYKVTARVTDNVTMISEVYASLWLVDGVAWYTYDYHKFNPSNPHHNEENANNGGKKMSPFAVVMIVLVCIVCVCCLSCVLGAACILVIVLIVMMAMGGGFTAVGTVVRSGVGVGGGGKGGYDRMDDFGSELDDRGTINKDLVPDTYGAL